MEFNEAILRIKRFSIKPVLLGNQYHFSNTKYFCIPPKQISLLTMYSSFQLTLVFNLPPFCSEFLHLCSWEWSVIFPPLKMSGSEFGIESRQGGLVKVSQKVFTIPLFRLNKAVLLWIMVIDISKSFCSTLNIHNYLISTVTVLLHGLTFPTFISFGKRLIFFTSPGPFPCLK